MNTLDISAVRHQDESMENYKTRRAANNAANEAEIKNRKVLWNSSQRGTYVKANHGALVPNTK